MFTAYRPTALETWVSQFYRRLRIYSPDQIDEQQIASALGIYLFYKDAPCMAYEIGRFKSITIDHRLPQKVQRERFFHELCHILRHSGWQIKIPQAFRELQENDARHFTRYAALPLHMINVFDFRDPDIISLLSERFNVSPELCEERLRKIKNNILSTKGRIAL